MSKYSEELKLRIVLEHKNENAGMRRLEKKIRQSMSRKGNLP